LHFNSFLGFSLFYLQIVDELLRFAGSGSRFQFLFRIFFILPNASLLSICDLVKKSISIPF